jgi:arsenate reductase (glutaredoxin)
VIVYGIPNCDTVRRARTWLDERGTVYRFHDFKKAGVPPERLDAWIGAVGWEKLVNRQGLMWKKLDEAARVQVVDATSARALMLATPSVIKRPVVEWPLGQITVGFDEARWAGLTG